MEPEPGIEIPNPAELSDEERERVRQVLASEYPVLAGALSSVWSASLLRTSLFLAVLSAVGVALGFAAQAGGGTGEGFIVVALVALPLALLLGLATFARTVEIQREAVVYIVGMNRIRYFMSEAVPASKPYLVLSTHDDELGIFRSQGTGIRFSPPRYRLAFALTQTQGIVGAMSAALAGAIAGFATAPLGPGFTWTLAPAVFIITLVMLFRYWNRSYRQLQAALRPMSPSPPGALDAPI